MGQCRYVRIWSYFCCDILSTFNECGFTRMILWLQFGCKLRLYNIWLPSGLFTCLIYLIPVLQSLYPSTKKLLIKLKILFILVIKGAIMKNCLIYLGFYAIGPLGKWLVEISIIVSQVGELHNSTVFNAFIVNFYM